MGFPEIEFPGTTTRGTTTEPLDRTGDEIGCSRVEIFSSWRILGTIWTRGSFLSPVSESSSSTHGSYLLRHPYESRDPSSYTVESPPRKERTEDLILSVTLSVYVYVCLSVVVCTRTYVSVCL